MSYSQLVNLEYSECSFEDAKRLLQSAQNISLWDWSIIWIVPFIMMIFGGVYAAVQGLIRPMVFSFVTAVICVGFLAFCFVSHYCCTSSDKKIVQIGLLETPQEEEIETKEQMNDSNTIAWCYNKKSRNNVPTTQWSVSTVRWIHFAAFVGALIYIALCCFVGILLNRDLSFRDGALMGYPFTIVGWILISIVLSQINKMTMERLSTVIVHKSIIYEMGSIYSISFHTIKKPIQDSLGNYWISIETDRTNHITYVYVPPSLVDKVNNKMFN